MLEPDMRHERADVRAPLVFLAAACLAVGLGAASLILHALLGVRVAALAREPDTQVAPMKVERPAPAAPDDAGLVAAERSRLSTWSLDPATGVWRMPIERAMAQVVARGVEDGDRP